MKTINELMQEVESKPMPKKADIESVFINLDSIFEAEKLTSEHKDQCSGCSLCEE